MSWRFRKSFSPFPGVRLTLSPSGISTSVGVGPFRATLGRQGPAITTRLPGTGLSYRHRIASTRSESSNDLPAQPVLSPTLPQLDEIKSAGAGALTTPGLDEFRKLLSAAKSEHAKISTELRSATDQEKIAVDKFSRWKDGFLLRRLFKSKFSELESLAEESSALRQELEQQADLVRIHTQIDIPQHVSGAFHRMCDDFELLTKSERIWDTVSHRAANRVQERTSATRIIERQPVTFALGRCEIINSEWTVPRLANANGGDIFLYPGFVLYFVSSDRFALLDYNDVEISCFPSRFIEEDGVPKDSLIVGSTWAKTNKDGSPDRRFTGNYEIPVAEYGKITITSSTGLNEEYMVSNVRQTEAFGKSWQELVNLSQAAG